MKERTHHLKQVQRHVLRSARKQKLKEINEHSKKEEAAVTKPPNEVIFDEFIPSNQQVPRINLGRQSQSFH